MELLLFTISFVFIPPESTRSGSASGQPATWLGGDIVLENFARKLKIKEGETTPDREFSLERVVCIGCCALAPVSLVDETVHGHMAPSKVEGIILGFEIEKERKKREKRESES